jgi:hypothetical protein
VVNDAARENVPEELQCGLILTIYEAKGLEFDDILLYNFFKDSQVNILHLLMLQDSRRMGCGPWNRPCSLLSLSKDSGKNSIIRSRILEARERIPA